MEHKGTSFVNSCVKVPVDPYSRQPTPSYERPKLLIHSDKTAASTNDFETTRSSNLSLSCDALTKTSECSTSLEDFSTFLKSIPDYNQLHHLSNEQFKQKLDYLKRKRKMLSMNLSNCIINGSDKVSVASSPCNEKTTLSNNESKSSEELNLKGKKCNFQESRLMSPLIFSDKFYEFTAEDQETNRYSCKSEKNKKTVKNKQISSERWIDWNALKGFDSENSDFGEIYETKSLPSTNSKRWHPTLPKPFNFQLRDDAEKYMRSVESKSLMKLPTSGKKKKRKQTHTVPLTSKIPLYDKLMAEKEERFDLMLYFRYNYDLLHFKHFFTDSTATGHMIILLKTVKILNSNELFSCCRSRIIREKSALNLLSQVKPFKLECEERAWRALAHSSPELRDRSSSRNYHSTAIFKAKPVPKNLFATEIYDRMMEDEYYRHLQKKLRAANLMRTSSLPPSMARRERLVKSAEIYEEQSSDPLTSKTVNSSRNSSRSLTSCPSKRERSISLSARATPLKARGDNLAAILRCQASRVKMEREMQERLKEQSREQEIKYREFLTSRKPAWKALRSSARHEHQRDLNFRTLLRRDEAREQAERHRIQMDMMLNRVMQRPTLFERHSQSYKNCASQMIRVLSSSNKDKSSGKTKLKRKDSSSTDSYTSLDGSSRSTSISLSDSNGVLTQSGKSSESTSSANSAISKSINSSLKKRSDRGQLKVSINENAELIMTP